MMELLSFLEALGDPGPGGLLELSVLGRLILASVFGGAIGLERELSGKEAGLRTNMLICVGASLLTVLSLRVGVYMVESGSVMGDPSRLMAAVISGIGFLGAGTIIQARGNITGLTTAATLWVVAAIGIAVGAGAYVIAAGSTAFVLGALIPVGKFEKYLLEEPIHWVQGTVTNLEAVNRLTDKMRDSRLKLVNTDISLREDNLYEVLVELQGKNEEFLAELSSLTEDNEEIKEITIVPGHTTS